MSSKKILNSTKCSFFQLILQINIDMTYSTNYIKNWIIFKREFQTYRIIKSLVRKAVDDKCPDGISPDMRNSQLVPTRDFYFRYCQAQLHLQLRAEIVLLSLLSVRSPSGSILTIRSSFNYCYILLNFNFNNKLNLSWG